MSKMLTGSIDLTKIDKSKIVSTDKNGNPFKNGGKFLSVVVWINDNPDQYGNNASIQISQSKEEREAKAKPTYIGNLKELSKNNGGAQNAPSASEPDDLPF